MYTDPGMGNLLIQVLIGAILAIPLNPNLLVYQHGSKSPKCPIYAEDLHSADVLV
jgi:hypothetical protein